jgi:hypothetical protein
MSRYYRHLIEDGYLLDIYPNAAAAFSLRLLRSGYTGNCIRVRRSSDNTEQDIGFSGGLLDINTLLSFVGVENAFVTTWYDQSGNNRNATQTTAGNQPRIVNGGVLEVQNTKPSLFFDGTNDRFTISNFQSSSYTNFAIFSVIKSDNNTNARLIFSKNNTTGNNRSFTFGIRDNQWSTNLSSDGASVLRIDTTNLAPGTTQRLITGLLSATETTQIDKFNFYRNSVLNNKTVVGGGSIGTSLFNPNRPFEIGSSNGGTSNFFFGSMQEIVFYENDQSSNRTAIETNINSHYNIY